MDKQTLQELRPDLAAQWHLTKNGDLTPDQFTLGSNKKVWWTCEINHEWYGSIIGRSRRSVAVCPYCSDERVLSGFNDLETKFPDIAKLWHPTKNEPMQVTGALPNSTLKYWWMCSEGHESHEWSQKVRLVSTSKIPCPICSNRQLMTGFNDLETRFPQIANQWHPIKNLPMLPSQVVYGSKFKAWWACPKGHDWLDTVSHRTGSNRNCSICAGQQVLIGYNDFETNHPELSKQWHPTLNNGLLPSNVTLGSNEKVWWECNNGHAWKSNMPDRVRGYSCSVCTNRTIVPGINDLSTRNPELFKEWNHIKNVGLSPNMVTTFSNTPAWWICSKGHEWEALISNRSIGNSCPTCNSQKRYSRGEGELLEVIAQLGIPNVIRNYRKFSNSRRVELDIYFPDLNFAIEFNGTYWHSEKFKDKNYHAEKMQLCKDAGIFLYQVWEDDWNQRRDVVIRGILHKLNLSYRALDVLPNISSIYQERIGARVTKISVINYQDAKTFLNENHIQGSAIGTHYLALSDKEERIRAVMVLKKTSKSGELSIERYATAGMIIGGFTKLLKYAEKEYTPKLWVTFADLSISDGELYDNNGFQVDKILCPDYSYFVRGVRVHKFNYRISRFKKDPNLIWEEGLTEKELASINGLHRIWDSGKTKYTKVVK